MSTVTILLAVDLTTLPTEVRLFASGENETSKGTFVFDETSAASVMAQYAEHGQSELPIDYEHQMVRMRGDATSTIAAGWFTPEVRNGELWATNIRWTPKAQQLLGDREYRYISPAFAHNKGVISRLVNFALTNLPATKDPLPLVAHRNEAPSEGKEQIMSDRLFKALGAADEAEALVIASEIDRTTKELLSATGTSKLADLLTAVRANAALPAEVQRLSQELEALKSADAGRERDALIAELSREGKLPPALHSWAKTQTVESLSVFAASAPVVSPQQNSNQPSEQNMVVLSAEDRDVMRQMGIAEDDEQWLKIRKAELEKKAARS